MTDVTDTPARGGHYASMTIVVVLFLVCPPVFNAMFDSPGWPILIALFFLAVLLSVIDGRIYRFNWIFPAIVAVAYLLDMALFFTEGTWIYLPLLGGVAALGNRLGAISTES